MLLVYFNAKINCRAWAINKKNHRKYLGLWPLGPGFSLTKAFRIVWPGLLRELDDDEVTKWGSTNVVSDEFEVARDELFCSERSCSWFELTSMPLDKQPPKNGCVLFKSTTYTDTFDILYATPIYKKVLFWVVRNLTIAMSYIMNEPLIILETYHLSGCNCQISNFAPAHWNMVIYTSGRLPAMNFERVMGSRE